MALKEREPEPPRKGPQCTYCQVRAGLDDHDRALLDKWIADLRNTVPTIVKWLREDGVTGIAPTAITRHRQKRCPGAIDAE